MAYWSYLAELIQVQNGVLIVDNVLSHANEVAEFIQRVEADDRFISTTLNVGAGLFMVTWRN